VCEVFVDKSADVARYFDVARYKLAKGVFQMGQMNGIPRSEDSARNDQWRVAVWFEQRSLLVSDLSSALPDRGSGG